MIIHNPILTGSFSVNGADLSTITGSVATSASFDARTTYLESTSSILTASSASLSVTSGSLVAASASLSATSGSLSAASASFNSRTTTLETYTTNWTAVSASFARTGSNNFRAPQYVSDTTVPTGFSNTTASIYTDGGLQVTKDSYFSGSMYIKGNLTIYGTQSVAYITSSQLNIATNIITVNTATPSVRFGGLSVYDSGSTGTGATGSLFWDSQNNGWVYQRESGSTYSGGMLISGPRRALGTNLGDEQGLTACMIPVAQGGDHITSSLIYHDSTVTCIYSGALVISSSCQFIFGTTPADFAFNVGTTCVGTNAGIAQFYNNDYTTGTRGFIRVRNSATIASTTSAYFGQSQDQKTYFYNNDPSRPGDIVITNTGKVGIGVSSPVSQLHISSFDCVQTTTLATAYTAAKFRLDTYCGSGQGISMGNITGFQQYIQAQYSNCTSTNPLMLNPFGGIVGIGTCTNNPTGQKLFIQSNNDQAGITMYNSYDCNMWALATGTAGINNKGFAIRDEINGVTRLQIDNSGNIGIGTLSPATKLEVYAGSDATSNTILWGQTIRNEGNGAATGYGAGLKLKISSDGTPNEVYKWAGIAAVAGTGYSNRTDLALYTNTASTVNATEKVRITGDGYVGIGTTSPSYPLEVAGATGTISLFRTNNATSTYNAGGGFSGTDSATATSRTAELFLDADGANFAGGDYFYIRKFGNSGQVNIVQQSNADMMFATNGATNERMRITSGGNVSIGTDKSCSKFIVDSNAAPNSSGWINTGTQFASSMASGLASLNVGAYDDGGTNRYGWIRTAFSDNAAVASELRIYTGITERIRITGACVGINNSCPRAALEVGQSCSDQNNGGFMFRTLDLPDNTWTTFYTPPASWAGLTFFNWVGTNDHNRSGAAQIRWSYQPCAAQLGPTTTIFNDNQNAPGYFRYSGGNMQICVDGAGAGKRLQVMIMGSRGA